MKDGWTAFHYAAFNGYSSTMEFLLDHGSSLNKQDKFNRTALHWAARFDNHQVVQKLLDLGIQYGVKDNEDNTAFDIARMKFL
jgi:ankyrin repeat protein